MDGIGGGGDYMSGIFVAICSFFMKITEYDGVNDSIRSNTTRRYTTVNLVSGNTTEYDRIRSYFTLYTTVNDRLRRRIRSFTAVVMLVLG